MQLYASLSTKHTLKPIICLSDTQGQEQGTQVQLKGCLIISVLRTCYIHVGVRFIKVPMYSIMQSQYFKHFHWKLLSKNCQNKGIKSFEADDSPLEQTLLTLPVWSKNWRNKETKSMSQEKHSSIIVMKRWGGLREASIKFISQKLPDDDEFFAKTISLELVYKVQYWFIQGSQ